MSQFAAIPGNTALQGFKTSSNSNNSGGNNSSSSSSSAGVAAGLVSGISAASQISLNQIQGKNFEDGVRTIFDFGKNSMKLGPEYGNRIPDGLDEAVRECKSGGYICNTQQLRDMMRYAKDNGLPFELYYKQGSKIAGTVGRAVDEFNKSGGTASLIPVTTGLGTTVLDAVPIFFVNPVLISPQYMNHGPTQKL